MIKEYYKVVHKDHEIAFGGAVLNTNIGPFEEGDIVDLHLDLLNMKYTMHYGDDRFVGELKIGFSKAKFELL